MQDKYIRQKEAEQNKQQQEYHEQDVHSDEPYEPFPVRPPFQQWVRQRQIPTRGRSGSWRGRGR
ncbi:hypothetical protein KI387_009547, partial [Taxus chinensis]